MKNKEELLYQKIIENSWISKTKDYLKFIYDEAESLESNDYERTLLIDSVLKRILNNIKSNVSLKEIKSIHSEKIKEVQRDSSFDLTINLIVDYYENGLAINGKTYKVLDMIFNSIQDIPKDKSAFDIVSDVLRNLFNLHYVLCLN